MSIQEYVSDIQLPTCRHAIAHAVAYPVTYAVAYAVAYFVAYAVAKFIIIQSCWQLRTEGLSVLFKGAFVLVYGEMQGLKLKVYPQCPFDLPAHQYNWQQALIALIWVKFEFCIASAFRAVWAQPNCTSTRNLVPALAALNDCAHYECEVRL